MPYTMPIPQYHMPMYNQMPGVIPQGIHQYGEMYNYDHYHRNAARIPRYPRIRDTDDESHSYRSHRDYEYSRRKNEDFRNDRYRDRGNYYEKERGKIEEEMKRECKDEISH